ncbi:hypothetical protein [Paenibacillus mucilaginosus]|uniref:Uncharacterized protein n=2 Tax=Paenibacillus mucilaginosus TaxID=61624 RepID=H6NRE6_9BACL|nr:hypothetical protein [Paenibacillus mucilaginosus]AEI45941.1 hypothetical protein KNP414_07437 [Paenibacillus mucilaginosus KNP414]AFC33581.1 hypothetical protein PM3016_6990 [Paenibacillus mucilaginosus 3016]MCG7216803.1 hypothetical protein [Paenibacillus mucilaginosus]WDM27293.1 hypothetical protein KCX80_33735 [Paenibacillus mucilaginosus]WFA21981.1 hypothetical protein ERY13_34700 [Paenibacillus mucilaginosus]
MAGEPLDEPIRPHGFLRFLIILLPCLLLRFGLGEIRGSFYFFIVLYFPMINWGVYWTMGSVRVLLNRLFGSERIRIAKLRKFYKWYLNAPGALVLSELVYQAYLFNR